MARTDQPILKLVRQPPRANRRSTREARDLLLPRLVSGELDVSELEFGSGGGGAVSPVGLTEDELVEQPALRLLSGLGWGVASGFEEVLGSEGTLGRDSQSEPVLGYRLRDSLRSLNPGLPGAALDEAVERLVEDRSAMGRVRANREVHDLLHEGAKGRDGRKRWEAADGDGPVRRLGQRRRERLVGGFAVLDCW